MNTSFTCAGIEITRDNSILQHINLIYAEVFSAVGIIILMYMIKNSKHKLREAEINIDIIHKANKYKKKLQRKLTYKN